MFVPVLVCVLLHSVPPPGPLAGVAIGSETYGFVSEDGDAMLFKVNLLTQPTSEVVVTLETNDSTEAFMSPSELHFNDVDWWVPQSVQVIGVDDMVADGHQPVRVETVSVTSSDLSYSGSVVHAHLDFVNFDREAPAAIVHGPLTGTVSEVGGLATFKIHLNSKPTGTVWLNLASTNEAEATVYPSKTAINSYSFATEIVVEVQGIDDRQLDGDIALSIVITVDSMTSDEAYTRLAPVTVPIVNKDNEVPPYIGCFRDPDQTTMAYMSVSSSMTVMRCVMECKAEGHKYAGLQYGKQCFCGDSHGSARLHTSRCDKPCMGDAGQCCGGAFRNSVYSTELLDMTPAPVVTRTYVGCFRDSPSRIMPRLVSRSSRMHVDLCIGDCNARGYAYAGVENGRECHCGHDISSAPHAVETQCNVACTGEATEVCGGVWRASVYTTEVKPVTPAPATPPVHVGCYKDWHNRAMEHYAFRSNAMTTEMCTNECRSRGYLYAGLQYSKQCFCGDAYDRYGPTSRCNKLCSGAPSQTCGGAWANTVYQVN